MQENQLPTLPTDQSTEIERKDNSKKTSKLILTLVALIIALTIFGIIGFFALRNSTGNNIVPSKIVTLTPTTIDLQDSPTPSPSVTEIVKQTRVLNITGQDGTNFGKVEVKLIVPEGAEFTAPGVMNTDKFTFSLSVPMETNYVGLESIPQIGEVSNSLGISKTYRILSSNNPQRYYYTDSFITSTTECDNLITSGTSYDYCTHQDIYGNKVNLQVSCLVKQSGGLEQCDQIFSSLEYKKL